METFKKGEDIYVDLVWKGADGNPITAESLIDYEIKLYSLDDNEEPQLVYAKDPIDVEKAIEVLLDEANAEIGVVRIKVDRDWSIDAEATNYFCDIYWYFPKEDGIDGKDLEVIEGVEIFLLVD